MLNRSGKMLVTLDMGRFPQELENHTFAPKAGWKGFAKNAGNGMRLRVQGVVVHKIQSRTWHSIAWLEEISNIDHEVSQ